MNRHESLRDLLRKACGTARHLKLVGSSGTYKTTFALAMILHLAQYFDDVGIACFLPVPEPALRLLLRLDDAMLLDRVVIHDIGEMRVTLPKTLLHVSTNRDLLRRRAENEEALDAFLAMPVRRRKDFQQLSERPAFEEFGKLAGAVYQYLDEWMPLTYMPQILDQDSVVQKWAIEHCADARTRAALIRCAGLNGHKQTAEVMPARRFLAGFLDNAQMHAMCSHAPTFSVAEHLRKGGIYVAIGGGSDDATTLSMAADVQQLVFAAKARKPENRWWVFRDEVLNYDLFGDFEAKAHNTMRNFNVTFVDALQAYDFDSPRVKRDFRTNSRTVVGGCRDFEMAEECARDLHGQFDEKKVHHTEETTKQRVVHGSETRVSEGSWEGPNGAKGKSKNVTHVPTTDHQEYVEKRDVYQDGREQVFWNAQAIAQLPDLVCFYQDKGPPTRHELPLPPQVCLPELFDAEVERCLEAIYRRPEYRTPRELEIIEPTTAAKPKQAPKKKPAGKPRPAGRTPTSR